MKPSTAAVLALLRQRGEQGLTPLEQRADLLLELSVPVQSGPGLFDAAAEAELDALL
jgi:hypothetical protein